MNQTLSGILATLANSGGTIVLGVQIGEEVVPLVKGIIQDVESAIEGRSITYTVALAQADAALDDAATLDQADLASINAELARLGQAAVQIPADQPITPPPAPGTTGSTTGEQGPAPSSNQQQDGNTAPSAAPSPGTATSSS